MTILSLRKSQWTQSATMAFTSSVSAASTIKSSKLIINSTCRERSRRWKNVHYISKTTNSNTRSSQQSAHLRRISISSFAVSSISCSPPTQALCNIACLHTTINLIRILTPHINCSISTVHHSTVKSYRLMLLSQSHSARKKKKKKSPKQKIRLSQYLHRYFPQAKVMLNLEINKILMRLRTRLIRSVFNQKSM